MQIADSSIVNVAIGVGIPSILGLQVWVVKKVSSFDVKFSRLETWAFGPTGTNGVNSRVTKVEDELESIKDRDREPR